MSRVQLVEVLDPRFGKVKFDNRLAKALYRFNVEYVNSNREYIEFYGGNLLGVQVVRFKDSDVNHFFDILDVDVLTLSEDLKAVTDINQDFKISSDVLNITIMYLLHRFINAPNIDGRTRDRALYDVAVLFFYRTIAALLSYNFKYPADPKIAQKAYANLNNKYLIKRLGSWAKVVDYRANKLIDPKGLHYENLKAFKDDLTIVYAMNDSQGRIKDLIKNYYAEFAKVHRDKESIGKTSSTVTGIEGGEEVKDKTHSIEKYVYYVKDLLTDEHGLIKDDLLKIISRINTNVSYRSLKTVLQWTVEHYNQTDQHKTIDEFIDVAIVHSFYLIEYTIRPSNLRDYPHILTQLKNLLASSRSTDKDLVLVKERGDKVVTLAFPYKISQPLVLATRSSLVLYLVLRVLVSRQP